MIVKEHDNCLLSFGSKISTENHAQRLVFNTVALSSGNLQITCFNPHDITHSHFICGQFKAQDRIISSPDVAP
jgi:hypothetical protein